MDILGRMLVTIATLSLIHCGYSSIQYRTYLKLIEEDFQAIPIDVSKFIFTIFYNFMPLLCKTKESLFCMQV